jgi:ubiquinone/menaquinone biosynthesis C-methylase UbiE
MHRDLQQVAEIFNRRAAGYVNDEWHQRYADQLVDVTPLRQGDRVLDAGTGTGFAARAIARRVGPTGRVLGVDISPRMLEQARTVIDGAHLANVDFLEADVSDLPDLATASFDAVVCSAGLLYMPVAEALREWHRLLVTDGVIAFSSMKAGSPLTNRLFIDCAKRFGLDVKDRSAPLGTEERCRQVLEEAGFDRVQLISGRVDFESVDLTLAWDANFRAAGTEVTRALSAEQQNLLRVQFLEALQHELQVNSEGARGADVTFAIARRPKGGTR